jgi:glycosyltransferase involved in cell wall biosynthesis
MIGRRLNVLAVNKFYYLRGGAERSVFETEKLLESHGHRVIPLAMSDERNRPSPYEKYFVDHVEFNERHSVGQKLKIVSRVIYYREARRRLEQLLRRERVDVAHLHNIAHQISPSILDSLRKYQVPTVQTLHDYKLICPTYTLMAGGEVCQRCLGGQYYHAALQRCNKGSLTASLLNTVEMYAHQALGLYRRGIDLYLAPSRFLKSKLEETETPGAPVVYLPNAIDADQYRPRYSDDGYGLYFGRLSPEKGVHTLIEAMKELPAIELRIIGEGLQQDQLQRMVEDHNLTNVRFIGPRYGDDLKEVLAGARFVVVPSECYENCPFSVLESFAMGKPVLGSAIGGIPELIEPGIDGLLFRPGDADDLGEKIHRLDRDDRGVIEMGRRARKKVEERFGLESHYRHLMAAYRSVIERQ